MLWDPRYSLVPGLGRIDTQPGSDYFYPGPHKIPENLPSWERNPTTLGNADFLSGAVPAHGLIPPPPSARQRHSRSMGPGMLTLPSLRQHIVVGKLNPLPLLGTPLRLGHTSWLVGVPHLQLVIGPPPRRSHTDLDCGCAYAHFVTQRRLDPKCHWLLVQPLCHEAAPTIGAEY